MASPRSRATCALGFAALLAASAGACGSGERGAATPPASEEPRPDGGASDGGAPDAMAVSPEEAELAAQLEAIRAEYSLPALGGAVVDGTGVTLQAVVGVRKVGDPTAARVDDPFHLGSDTKAISAVVLAKLIEAKKLTYETTVAKAFPELVGTMNAAYEAVTLADLLAMKGGIVSGWPDGESYNSLMALTGTPREQRETFVKAVLASTPAATPKTKFVYSNASYVLAAVMGERAGDAAWEDQARDLVFSPLAMTGWGFGAAGAAGAVDAPWPHVSAGGALEPVEPGPGADNPIVLSPAGRAHMPLAAWGKFIADVMGGLAGKGGLLPAASYQALLTPRAGEDYAGGFVSASRDWGGGTVFMHTGSNTMNYAVVWMAPARGRAVLVVTNAGGGSAPEACDKAVERLLERAGLVAASVP